jgi:hypothetical protein
MIQFFTPNIIGNRKNFIFRMESVLQINNPNSYIKRENQTSKIEHLEQYAIRAINNLL